MPRHVRPRAHKSYKIHKTYKIYNPAADSQPQQVPKSPRQPRAVVLAPVRAACGACGNPLQPTDITYFNACRMNISARKIWRERRKGVTLHSLSGRELPTEPAGVAAAT